LRESMKGRPVFVRPTRAASRTRRSSFGLVLLALPAALFASSANSRACVPLAAARRCHAFRHPRTFDDEKRDALIPALSPPPKARLSWLPISSAKGRFARRREEDEVAVSRGPDGHIRHSGDAGAPPGTTTSPCQELADDLDGALNTRRPDLKRGPALA